MKHLLPFLSILFLIQISARSDEGMWIPMFLNELNEAEMQAMGMNITAEDIYGNITLDEINERLKTFAQEQGFIFENYQSNTEFPSR